MNIVILSLSGKLLLCKNEYPSLLAALESHKVIVEYQCRSGYCGSCRCRLIQGQVNWITKPLACVHKEEILPCCCQAKGNIEIEI